MSDEDDGPEVIDPEPVKINIAVRAGLALAAILLFSLFAWAMLHR